MFEVVLFEPEIPPNTGNIIRLCANTGTRLHLVRPLGFRLNEKTLARAGLDYRGLASLRVHPGWAACRAALGGRRMFAFTTKGSATPAQARFGPGDALVFGPESRGLPEEVLTEFEPERRLRLPMAPGSRSLNLANAVAVAVYEAWRQNGFAGGN